MEEEVEQSDPFSPENMPVVQFIATARLYDVLMALLQTSNAELAKEVLKMHAAGHLVGPAPRLSGVFLSDEMNSPADEMNSTEKSSEEVDNTSQD